MTDQQQQDTPEMAVWLGYGGLVPFAICAAAAHGGTPILAAYGLIGAANYGAVIHNKPKSKCDLVSFVSPSSSLSSLCAK